MRTAAHLSRAPLVLTVLAGALAAAPVAHAAYAPRLDVSIDPSAHATPSALTLTVTQAEGEDASRAFELQIPSGFAISVSGSTCSPSQEASFACPEDSRLGLAQAATPSGGAYTGGIYYGGGSKVVVLLTNGGVFAQPLTLEGSAAGSALAFPSLPGALVTGLSLRFGGAPRALLTTPDACGTYVFVGRFTSAGGATLDTRAPVNVDGCTENPPQISAIRVTPRVARAGRRAAVAFRLSEDAAVEVRMRRIGHGGGRLVGRLDGRAGANTLALATRGARPGTYELALQATDPTGLRRTRTTRLRIVRRRISRPA
jgi:hypothetical protein